MSIRFRASLGTLVFLLIGFNSDVGAQQTYTLTATKSKDLTIGGVEQYATTKSIDCGYWEGSTNCSHSYPAGTIVVLSGAAYTVGAVWGSWGGDCAGSGATQRCVLTMNSNKSVSATAKTTPPVTIRIPTVPTGGRIIAGTSGHSAQTLMCPGDASNQQRCSFTSTTGAKMGISAYPDKGYTFGGWTGACASNARSSCDLTLTSDVSIGATFNAIPDPFQFTVDAPAKATVQITIDGKIQLCNGQKCTYPSAQGTKVAISVAPYVNYILESWGGSCAGVRDNVCYVTLSSNHMNVTVRVGPK